MFVTGCHRSGTSLLAALVHDLVVGGETASGRHGDLACKLENPLGFFESERLVELNDLLLGQIGSSWDAPPLLPQSWSESPLLELCQDWRGRFSRYALGHQWVDKDPRLCITYPAFLHILLKRVPLVAALRQPIEVATSLYARNGMPLDAGLALWFLYNHHLAAFLEPTDLVIGYGHLLTAGDPAEAFELHTSLTVFLESHGYAEPPLAVWSQVVAQRLRPELNRATYSLPQHLRSSVTPALLQLCERAYGLALAGITPFQDAFEALPRPVLLALQCHRLVGQFPPLEASFPTAATAELEQLRQALDAQQASELSLRRRLEAIETSRIWRFTEPLRRCKDQWLRRPLH